MAFDVWEGTRGEYGFALPSKAGGQLGLALVGAGPVVSCLRSQTLVAGIDG